MTTTTKAGDMTTLDAAVPVARTAAADRRDASPRPQPRSGHFEPGLIPRRRARFRARRRTPMIPSVLRSFAIVLLALLWPVAAIGGPAAHAPDELLVRFRAGTAPAHGAALHAAAGAVPLRTFRTVRDLHLVKLPRGLSTAQALARYRKLPEVLYAEPNYLVTLQAVPNDPHFLAGDLWGLNAPILTQDIDIDAPEAWDLATGSAAVVLAVIDS